MTGQPIRRVLAVLAAAALTAALTGSALAADPEVAANKKRVVECDGVVATKVGTKGADRLKGTAGRDVIAGLGGNDIIIGRGGNDIICGGAGNDRLVGGAGHDKLLGQTGRDRLFGGTGVDRLFGGLHNDLLAGQAGPDVLFGGAGFDRLDGGIGIDTCYQNTGHGPLIRCELPRPPLHDLTGIHAIAYSDIDGRDGYSTGDVLISKLVDTQADGVPGWGDTVVMGRYPTNLGATAFADWGVTEHHVELVEVYITGGRTFHIGIWAANGDIFDWYDREGTWTYEWYQEESRSSGSAAFFDTHFSPEADDDDSIWTTKTSPSRPQGIDASLGGGRQADDEFIDVQIVYQKP